MYKARGGDCMIILISAQLNPDTNHTRHLMYYSGRSGWPALLFHLQCIARSDDAIRTQQDLAGLRDENFTT